MNNTLLVGPFPKSVSLQKRESLLKHFGAVDLQHVFYKKQKVSIKAKFSSHEQCKQALTSLHQFDILGKKLFAKFCNRTNFPIKESHMKIHDVCSQSSFQKNASEVLQPYEAQLTCISSKFGLDHPNFQGLRYAYPPPTASTIANISNALASVPKFYTQVLHLMNKMNLSVPFKDLSASNSVLLEAAKLILSSTARISDVSDSESELESDPESKYEQIRAPKRSKRPLKKINKRPKIEQLRQTYDVQTKVHDPPMKPHPSLTLNVPKEILPVKETVNQKEETEGFGKIFPETDKVTVPKTKDPYITVDTLRTNRVQKSEFILLPVLRDYSPGEPSCKLYIKNLAKDTLESDLKFIFGRFVDWTEIDSVEGFSIKLMKQGRMKGQAFITFQDTVAASKALSETNGFILKDKPMVVVFGKTKTS